VRVFPSLAALVLLGAPFAEAQRVPVLAELFTSEGCSSCPPADQLLQRIDQLQPISGAQVLVLGEHVDYWDQLGWRDPFSSAQFTRRQQQYSHALGGEVYTPQLVVDGREQVLGSDATAVRDAVARAAAKPKIPVHIVTAKRDNADALLTVSVAALPKGRAEVWAAIADESARSSVTRGENAGRALSHVAVVRSLTKIGSVSKSEAFEKAVRLPVNAAPSRIVVFLSQDGAVIGADFARLP
jgi:hypothetical protein